MKQQYKFYRSLLKRPDRIVPIIINRIEFLSYQINQVESNQQIKQNGRKQKKWIKSNHTNTNTRNDYTTWVWLLWISYEVNSTIFINNTLFLFRLNILLNESSSLTFWIRFGISNYNPYSLFWSTYQCNQNKDTRNHILQNWWMFDLEDPHSIISNHFIITSHYQRTWIIIPSFSPILQYPISQYTHCFLLIPFITIQTFINGWIIDCQIGTVWFFVFIDSICFLDKKYGYRLW